MINKLFNKPKERLGTKCYAADTTDSLGLTQHTTSQAFKKGFDGDDDKLKIEQLIGCCCDSLNQLGETETHLCLKQCSFAEAKTSKINSSTTKLLENIPFRKRQNASRSLPSYN